MKKSILAGFILSCFLSLLSNSVLSQTWQFIKEKDGIKVYTRKETDSNLKSYRGVTDLHTKIEKLYGLIGNPKNTDWWTKDISEIKILLYEKEKHVQYYLVYDVPWPLTDRDLVVDAVITTDPVTGTRIVKAVPLPGVIPEKEGRIRIKKYWQTWTISQNPDGTVHVVLEGFVDPAGSIPAWLYNMVITDTPLKVIGSVKSRTE
jgi:hypothetical protein